MKISFLGESLSERNSDLNVDTIKKNRNRHQPLPEIDFHEQRHQGSQRTARLQSLLDNDFQ